MVARSSSDHRCLSGGDEKLISSASNSTPTLWTIKHQQGDESFDNTANRRDISEPVGING